MAASAPRKASADAAPALARELFEAAATDLVRLSDPRGCERLLRSRRLHEIDLNAVYLGRSGAIDLVQRAMRSHAGRLQACRRALERLEATIDAGTADEVRAGVALAREVLAAALAVRSGEAAP